MNNPWDYIYLYSNLYINMYISPWMTRISGYILPCCYSSAMYMGIDFKNPFTSPFHVARVAKLGHPTTGSMRIWSQSGNSSANKSGWETMCQHFLLSRLDLECRLSPALT